MAFSSDQYRPSPHQKGGTYFDVKLVPTIFAKISTIHPVVKGV